MNTPNLYRLQHLIEVVQCNSREVNGQWVPCRPLGFQGLYLVKRLRLTWGVFTGKYDAVKWEGQ